MVFWRMHSCFGAVRLASWHTGAHESTHYGPTINLNVVGLSLVGRSDVDHQLKNHLFGE